MDQPTQHDTQWTGGDVTYKQQISKAITSLGKFYTNTLWGWYISIRSPFRKTKNVISWLPTIWNDNWHSEHWLYEVMRFKISRMEKKFRKEGHFVGHKKVADHMRVCTLLLDRLIKDEYWETTTRFHDKKWGKISQSSKPTDNPLLSELILSRPNVITEKDEIQESKESKRCWEMENYLYNQDLEYLSHIMRRTIRNWSD